MKVSRPTHKRINEEDNFRIMDTKGLATMLTSTTKTMTVLLVAVAVGMNLPIYSQKIKK